MGNRGTQFVIAGSGAGGATVARELSRAGKKVLVVERGEREKKLAMPRSLTRSSLRAEQLQLGRLWTAA